MKINKVVLAGFLDEIKLIKEKKNAKWASIEDALKDFANRNGFSIDQRKVLEKLANTVSVDKAFEEGLGTQAIEFMMNRDNLHFDNQKEQKQKGRESNSPFVLKPQDKNYLEKAKKERLVSNPLGEMDLSQNNEFINAKQKCDFRKYAQEEDDGQRLREEKDLSKLKEISKEMEPSDITQGYELVRLGFEFKSLHSQKYEGQGEKGGAQSLIKKGDPIKVVVYKYTAIANTFADFINYEINKQIEEKISLGAFLDALKNMRFTDADLDRVRYNIFVKTKELSNLVQDEEKLKTELLKNNVIIEDALVKFLKKIPAIFQWKIINEMVEDKYRHMMGGNNSLARSQISRTSYVGGQFLLMENYNPLIRILPTYTRENKNWINAIFVANGKDYYTFEEFKDFLEEMEIPYRIEQTHIFKNKINAVDTESGEQLEVIVESDSNPDYKPLTHSVSDREWKDPEIRDKMLRDLHGNIASLVKKDLKKIQKHQQGVKKSLSEEDEEYKGSQRLEEKNFSPVTFEYDEDGQPQPVNLMDLKRKAKDYTDLESNQNFGLHYSYDTNHLKEEYEKRRGKKNKDLEEEFNLSKPIKASIISSSLIKKAEFLTKPLFMTEDGKFFSSKEIMEDIIFKDMLLELKDSIVELVADKMMESIQRADDTINVKIINKNVINTPPSLVKEKILDDESEQKLVADLKLKIERLIKGN